MGLFYIHGEVHMGDADGPFNLDLFVYAVGRKGAFTAWERHFKTELADYGRPDEITIFKVLDAVVNPQHANAAGVVAWDKLDQITLAGNGNAIP